MSKSEIWVCRELMRQGPDSNPYRMTKAEADSILDKVVSGDLAVAPDGMILEPVELCGTELYAQERMRELSLANPKHTYRVILSVEVKS